MLKGRVFNYTDEFTLESGQTLPGFQLFYTTWGTLNEDSSNVVWVCHAFTGNAFVKDWWGDLFGEGKTFDPAKHFIVCANSLGSCYGSTGPLSQNPDTGRPYYHKFPILTIRDSVKAFDALREHLEIEQINVLIGGSIGGQQALEWAVEYPEVTRRLVQIAANARQTPWAIALNESQRMAIEQDMTWQLATDDAGLEGMKTARSVALLSYRTYNSYNQAQKESSSDLKQIYRAATYQQYQGEKLAKRFNAFSYWQLTKMMDSHNVGRNRGGLEEALRQVQAETLVIGVDKDQLFPVNEQRFVSKYIPNASFQIIHSEAGHDGFLLETAQLSHLLDTFLQKKQQRKTWIPTVF
ncbi:homoserine O-acetyltransferase MetX [Rufibacter tibetensis]|uniref:Homoserine O-acetyltransferase n=1 Tax=Rufibacter tibetensis TaxID=512763 RepID=A0A0P0CZU9_9BACT|nr:homoserine O-acetyltransferase [Rufibacter tibetensis]ALJ01024.1 homoserine O-acetyltransferase [Rufibacter tibetensis]